MDSRKEITLLEMQSLMLEALACKDTDIDYNGNNFSKHRYQGTQWDLFRITEKLAIKHEIIQDNIDFRGKECAWGGTGWNLYENSTTNFKTNEINKLYETFNTLLNRGIISPGYVEACLSTPSLPQIHVTDYGKKCLEVKDILPYDSDGYLDKLGQIKNLNEWIKFYLQQALECFNNSCYEASLIMIGLANEKIINETIEYYLGYLNKKAPAIINNVKKKFDEKNKISEKFSYYQYSLKKQKEYDKDLKGLSSQIDKLAVENFQTYVRLTRNDLSHPNELKTDRITTLMIFISFVSYCERMYKYINYYKNIN